MKRCSSCMSLFPANSYTKSKCKPCVQSRQLEWKREQALFKRVREMLDPPTLYTADFKYCASCDYVLHKELFGLNNALTDKLTTNCRECNAAYINSQYHKHRIKRIAEMKDYRKANPEIVKSATKRWRDNNPDKVLFYGHNYRAAKRGVMVEKVDIEVLRKEQNDNCAYCLLPLDEDTHLDHIVPISKGGEHSYSNTCLAHARCNISKGFKSVEQLIQENWFQTNKLYMEENYL